jgi:hypothetical protein
MKEETILELIDIGSFIICILVALGLTFLFN